MAVQFRLPDLGEGIAEGELVRWLVNPGDRVGLDQAIAEVQTDKAVVELPSPVAGTVLTLDVAEGQVVPVDTLLLTIEDTSQEAVPSVPPADATASGAGHGGIAQATPGVGGIAQAAPTVSGSGTRLVAPLDAGHGQQEAANSTSASGRWSAASVAPTRRVLATPAVRRRSRELGIDIATVRGSGPAGRVLAEDLQAAASAAFAPVEASTSAETEQEITGGVGPVVPVMESLLATMPGAADGPSEERLPLRGLRRRIAENMVLSVTTVPQVTSLVEVDATGLVALRRGVLAAAEAAGVKLSYLPFIVKALVRALRAYPYVNASIDDSSKEIVLKRHYHIGIATATPDGLLVPVLRHADRLTVLEIAAELNRLAEGGRARTLALDELRGSTFTISNYGTVGGFFATPIINPGEAGILGLGRIAERPWAVDGRVEARPVLPLSFTADHRLIDGELAMRFLNTLVASLENPNLLLLEMR